VGLGVKLSERLREKRTAGNAGGSVKVSDGGCHAVALVREAGALAVLLDRIEVWRDTAGSGGKKVERVLEEQSKAIVKKIDYLLESLKEIEFDRGAKTIQMRSGRPLRDGGELHYYELMLAGGSKVTLQRYRVGEGEPGRSPVAFSITLDVLERLVDDLEKVLRLPR
jgi:hypothetical protein